MANTIQDLIESLQRIEDKSQVYVGDIWIAEDFTVEDEDTVEFTLDELAKVAQWRSVGKSLGYFYEQVLDSLYEARGNN